MSAFVLILLFLAAIALAVLFLKSKRSEPPILEDPSTDVFPYQAQAAFLTPAERSFFGVLEQAVGDSSRVFAKVRLADLLVVEKSLDRGKRFSAQNKINSKHVDFVLCDIDRVAILTAIELDDKSHDAKNRQDRDFFVDEAFKAAGIPLVRVPAKKGYTLSEIKLLVSGFIGPENFLTDAPVTDAPVTDAPVTDAPVTDASVAPVCPACENTMVKRRAKKGKHAGSFFWACTAFPKCRQLIPIQ